MSCTRDTTHYALCIHADGRLDLSHNLSLSDDCVCALTTALHEHPLPQLGALDLRVNDLSDDLNLRPYGPLEYE